MHAPCFVARVSRRVPLVAKRGCGARFALLGAGCELSLQRSARHVIGCEAMKAGTDNVRVRAWLCTQKSIDLLQLLMPGVNVA